MNGSARLNNRSDLKIFGALDVGAIELFCAGSMFKLLKFADLRDLEIWLVGLASFVTIESPKGSPILRVGWGGHRPRSASDSAQHGALLGIQAFQVGPLLPRRSRPKEAFLFLLKSSTAPFVDALSACSPGLSFQDAFQKIGIGARHDGGLSLC